MASALSQLCPTLTVLLNHGSWRAPKPNTIISEALKGHTVEGQDCGIVWYIWFRDLAGIRQYYYNANDIHPCKAVPLEAGLDFRQLGAEHRSLAA